MPDRREFLKAAGAAGAVLATARCGAGEPPKWDPSLFRPPVRSRTAILPHDRYDDALTDTIARGIRLFGLAVNGKRVLLKPNLVEFDPQGVINTHPALISATIEAFRRLGAREVTVGEGPGHRRDNEYLLERSGLAYALRDTRSTYVDLNTDRLRRTALRSRFTGLGALQLPATVLDTDLFVSMPKLKTHKWAGATLSLKNLFGIVPGAVYGWPKNLLHWHGIAESIIDINAALTVPRFNIVDGIIGMEGNGPISGQPRQSGVVVFGEDPVAVDATCARLMSLDPGRLDYIREAAAFLGNAEENRIEQLGSAVAEFRQDYYIPERLSHLKL